MKPDHTNRPATTVDPAPQNAPATERLCHRIGLAAALVATAGSIVLGTGPAYAVPRTAAAPAAPRAGHTGDGTIHQGWDGSVYWFRGDAGTWRYTRQRDVYLSRIAHRVPEANRSGAPGAGATPGASAAPGAGAGAGVSAGVSASPGQSASPNAGQSASPSAGAAPAAGPATASHGSDPGSGAGPGPGAGSGSVETAVEFALAQLGKPYVFGGNGPNGFDCSGLIQQSFRRAGVSLPRVASDQYAATTPVSEGRLRRGDLLFWSSDGTARGIHHAAIYLGDGSYVEAPKTGSNVRIHKLARGYWPTQMGRP